MLALSANAFGANWLMVQGTEAEGAEQLARVWGFVQVQYQEDSSDPNSSGGYIPPKTIGPNLTTQSSFNVNRARIGVRGVAMPLDQKINYFLLLELGNNGITAPTSSFAKATDASTTSTACASAQGCSNTRAPRKGCRRSTCSITSTSRG